jgi:hypothetical protein
LIESHDFKLYHVMHTKKPVPKLVRDVRQGQRSRARGRARDGDPGSPARKKRSRLGQSEVETAATDAPTEISDISDATEASAKPTGVPAAVLDCRLNKSNSTIEQLQKEKAEKEKRMADLLEADKKRKDEEAKAAKISKVVESASPGAVVHVGRQVNSYLLPSSCFLVKVNQNTTT